jgi:selenocysteine lyase/cysteine desulfurase
MPTCAFVVDGWSPADLAARLAEQGVVVSAGTQCAPSAHDALGVSAAVRVSFGPLHDDDDADRAAAALRSTLRG